MTDHRDIGLEQHDGHAVGRDPRTMSADELTALDAASYPFITRALLDHARLRAACDSTG